MVTIQVFRAPSALLDLRSVWNDLLVESDANTIFLTWEWAASWWHAFGSSFELCILQCSDATGRPVGIIPLLRTRERVGPLLSSYSLYTLGDLRGGSEKLDWIVRDGWEQPVVAAVLDWLEGGLLKWDILYYNTARAESRVAGVLVAECQRRGWILLQRERPTYRVAVSASWDEYLTTLSKKMRNGVQQQIRRADRDFKVRSRMCNAPDQLEKDLQTLFALHAKRWQQRGKTGNLFQPEKQVFYHEVAKNCLGKDWLEFWVLEFDDNPVACEFGFRYNGAYSFLQAGFDPEYKAQGVGVVLRAAIMRSLIERRFRIYDFLLGEDDYKERWAGKRYMLLDFSLARGKSWGHNVLASRGHLIRAISLLRNHLPKPVWASAGRIVRSIMREK